MLNVTVNGYTIIAVREHPTGAGYRILAMRRQPDGFDYVVSWMANLQDTFWSSGAYFDKASGATFSDAVKCWED